MEGYKNSIDTRKLRSEVYVPNVWRNVTLLDNQWGFSRHNHYEKCTLFQYKKLQLEVRSIINACILLIFLNCLYYTSRGKYILDNKSKMLN